MKKYILLLIAVSVMLLSANKKTTVDAATITSVTHTQAGDVVCWNYTSDSTVGCVTIEVKSKETNNQFRTTLCNGCANCLSTAQSGSACNTFNYNGNKGRTYRLRVLRTDWTSYYSNEVSL